MIALTETYIDALAPNASAVKNAKDLLKKRKFNRFHRSADATIIFAECAGSGSVPYECSADFVNAEKPVLRCSCPSRQLPCKHALGLLYAHLDNEDQFSEAPVPESLASKREKAAKQEEKKAQQAQDAGDGTAAAKPKRVNKSALKKKIEAQLEGVSLLEKLTRSIVGSGLATLDKKTIRTVEDQAKQLGNYYLPGAQSALLKFALFAGKAVSGDAERDAAYANAVEQLTVLHALVKKGKAVLTARLEDPDLKLDSETTIEEWLGHAWQLTELKSCGLVSEQASLVQLSFYSYDDEARMEYVDVGYWVNLNDGAIHRTMSYRPYKAAKHMREDDSFFDVVQTKELYLYPGDMNRRVRWEEMNVRPVTSEDISAVASKAHRSFAEAIKLAKNQIKNPLADKHPVMLLHAKSVMKTEDGRYAATDEYGQTLLLGDIGRLEHATTPLLSLVASHDLTDSALLVMFEHRHEGGRLHAQPMTILNGADMIRLFY